MKLEFNQAKRKKTLQERGLDFARAVEVFDGSMIVMVWTPRGEVRRIISMRKANDREKTLYASYLD
jgi:uncharacterized DUF497 family protein